MAVQAETAQSAKGSTTPSFRVLGVRVDAVQIADVVRQMEEMGRAARREYEEKYTPENNYTRLMEICQRVTGNGNVKMETSAAAVGKGD